MNLPPQSLLHVTLNIECFEEYGEVYDEDEDEVMNEEDEEDEKTEGEEEEEDNCNQPPHKKQKVSIVNYKILLIMISILI